MSLISQSPTYNIPIRGSHRLMGSFDHDSFFLPRTYDDTHIYTHDLNPIMEHNSSHSSHDDDALRVLPLQVDKLSNEFHKLDT